MNLIIKVKLEKNANFIKLLFSIQWKTTPLRRRRQFMKRPNWKCPTTILILFAPLLVSWAKFFFYDIRLLTLGTYNYFLESISTTIQKIFIKPYYLSVSSRQNISHAIFPSLFFVCWWNNKIRRWDGIRFIYRIISSKINANLNSRIHISGLDHRALWSATRQCHLFHIQTKSRIINLKIVYSRFLK